VSLYKLLVEFIDLRSFSNLWFWVVLVAIWVKAVRNGLGVPYALVRAAQREGGQALQDLETLARLSTTRMLGFSRGLGPWLVGAVSFAATVLALLGFAYRSGLAQALFCLFAPLCLLGYISLRAALRVEAGEGQGAALIALLGQHRRSVQFLATLAVGATLLFGAYANAQLFAPR
jgi:hypothetical protein